MSLKNSYKTVEHDGGALLVEKKSKFFADVKPVDNEPDAIEFLNSIRSKYPDARHHVYAYVIDENNIFRYSDDGEPSGTAGMPVLDTIRKSGIVDAVVVVTRYFGGTLLGTGGLVRAYSGAAKMGLEAAHIIMRELCDIVEIRADYSLLGKIQYMLASGGYMLENTEYGDEVVFTVACPIDTTERLVAEVTDLTNARAECAVKDKKYVNREINTQEV